MCTELMKLVESVLEIFPEIEAARPRCESGIHSLVHLNFAIDKAKSLIRDCSESSKLYLVCMCFPIIKLHFFYTLSQLGFFPIISKFPILTFDFGLS